MSELQEVEKPAVSTEQAQEGQPEATEHPAASAAAEPETQDDATKKPEGGEDEGGLRGIERRFKRFSRDIDGLRGDVAKANAELEFWRNKALGQPEVTPKPKPKPEDFDSTEAFFDARDEWAVNEARRVGREEAEKHGRAEAERTTRQQGQQEWEKQLSAATEKSAEPNFRDGVQEGFETLRDLNTPAVQALGWAIPASEHGPELLYFFGKNPEEAERIAKLNPTAAVIALGRIEARLVTDNPGDEKSPQTRAPKPITPVKKTSSAQKLDPDDPEDAERMSSEDWLKAREAKLNRR